MFQSDPTPEDLAMHKALLQRLIADGEHVATLIGQLGLPANLKAITPESVAATLELLRADFRGRHEPMPAGRRAQVLKEALSDVA